DQHTIHTLQTGQAGNGCSGHVVSPFGQAGRRDHGLHVGERSLLGQRGGQGRGGGEGGQLRGQSGDLRDGDRRTGPQCSHVRSCQNHGAGVAVDAGDRGRSGGDGSPVGQHGGVSGTREDVGACRTGTGDHGEVTI